MSQRIALSIAAALTVFVLIVVGGLASRLSSLQPAPAAVAATEVPPVAATSDTMLQATIAARDAAYQQALAEANARIEAANAQVEQANAQVEQANAQLEQANAQVEQANARSAAAVVAPVAPAAVVAVPAAQAPTAVPPAYQVSAEQASALAQAAAYGATPSKAPELVSLQGVPAYEVIFPQGLVYIDADSGAVIASSIPSPAPAAPGFEEHEEREHEEREHEQREHEAREAHEAHGEGDDD